MNEDGSIVEEEYCFIPQKLGSLREKLHKESGFMGATHALSAVAGFLAIVAFAPTIITKIAGAASFLMIICIAINIVGGSLNNDLDNTNSTAESSLGFMGSVLSAIYRGSSEMVQTTVRTNRDDKDPNPHRGLYHTIPGCLVVAGIVAALMTISGSATIPHIGHVSYAWIVAFIATWLNFQMAMTGLMKSTVKSIKKSGPMGDVVFAAICFVITLLFFMDFMTMKSFYWVPISIFIGMIIHIVGDMFTTYGNPTLFPIPYRGKMWWRFRILPIHAGGVVEKWVFIPVFSIVSLVSLFTIVMRIHQ